MFEFGRDLKKLFDKAREGEDLGWVELLPVELVAREARAQSVEAGRISARRPFDHALRAAALWREHGRRSGARTSLERARVAASDAARAADTADRRAQAAVEAAEIQLLSFDLFGGPGALDAGVNAVHGLDIDRAPTRAAAALIRARLEARRAELSDDPARLDRAMADLDSALEGARDLPACRLDEARLERAALGLITGVARCEARLLDDAGGRLRDLVSACPGEQRPLTRARALALAGTGLSALGALARDAAAQVAGQALFQAAADQFTVDHSPLDWVAVQLVLTGADGALAPLHQAEALTREPGLVLGALARERRMERAARLAGALGDLNGLTTLEEEARARLRARTASPLDWAADQIGLGSVAKSRARLTGEAAPSLGLMLAEAALTAREQGAVALARRAEAVLAA